MKRNTINEGYFDTSFLTANLEDVGPTMYYGIVENGDGKYAEVAVSRKISNSRIVNTPTGIVYRSWKEAKSDNESKNAGNG